MTNFKRAFAFMATAASLLAVPAASLAASGAAIHAAVTAAQSDYRHAVARCNRMSGGARHRCLQDAGAARKAAMASAQDAPVDAKLMDLNLMDLHLLPAAEGAQGGAFPDYRDLPDVRLVPDNLASNAAR